MLIQFKSATYQISENDSPVRPMLIVSRPLTVDVMVQVDAENISALGIVLYVFSSYHNVMANVPMFTRIETWSSAAEV